MHVYAIYLFVFFKIASLKYIKKSGKSTVFFLFDVLHHML